MAGAEPLAIRLTRAFYQGELDLSVRPAAPRPGWAAMPECVATETLRGAGATWPEVRLFLTLVAALDRARDADRLWHAATRLYLNERWALDPLQVVTRGQEQLIATLRAGSVSQRHRPDSDAWFRISRALVDRATAPAVHAAVFDGEGDVAELLTALKARDETRRPLFPMLGGPKVSRMWIRMLAAPGGARIAGLPSLPVAVDVQVQKVTRYLGVLDVSGRPCVGETRDAIQEAWHTDVARGGAEGPPGLVDTCAALDPALWFYGKWGCTFCERAGRRLPISPTCGGCSYEAGRTSRASTSPASGQAPRHVGQHGVVTHLPPGPAGLP